MQIWPRNTETERSSVNHIVDIINIVMFTVETTPSHVMIGHGLVDSDHVSLRWLEGCLSEWEFIK